MIPKFLHLGMLFYRYFTLFLFLPCLAGAQGIYIQGKFQFTAYEKIPAWACVASGWETQNPTINLYDYQKYKGHANFVSFGLKTGITFAQFKEQVKHYASRKYLPFFLYDLRKNPFKKNNQSYTWAIRLEDYAYDDNPEQMTETVIKLYKSVETYVSKETGKPAKGLLILAVSEKVLPNMSIKKSLENSGIGNILLKELIGHAGASKTIVLNPGTAIGTLKYVKASENESVRLGKNDIVLFEKTPLRIPPVAGIITLEPQTPLSHVNLLAKNRGTINISTDKISSIPNLEKALNHPVKIVCDKSVVTVSIISKAELDEYVTNKPANVLLLRHADEFTFTLVPLDTADKKLTDIGHVGAKAANFSTIHNAFPTYMGNGYAIPHAWYLKHVRECNIQPIIDSLYQFELRLDDTKIEAMLGRMRKAIQQTPLDSNLVKMVMRLQKNKFQGQKIRLRSSTNCEDLPFFNGAGLYVSYGFIREEGKKELEQKIKKIYASLWTFQTFKERSFYHMDQRDPSMAILISNAYENEEANGVALTIPSEKNVSVYINAQPGSHLVTNPKNGEIPEALFFNLSTDDNYETRSHSSFSDVFLMKENEPLLQELKNVAIKIHNLLTKGETKYGTDIEFKIIKECGEKKLIIKQARLIYDANPY
jgi:hypothetical protein